MTTAATSSSNPAVRTVRTVDAERFKQCVFLRLSIHRFGNRAKVRNPQSLVDYYTQQNAELETEATTNGEKPVVVIAGSGVSTTKRLVQSEPLDKLNEFLTETKNSVLKLCNPSQIMPGLVVTSAANYQKLNEQLENAVADMQLKYVPDFATDYEPAITRSRDSKIKDGGLGPLFVQSDYPNADAVTACFGIEWFPVSLRVPDNIPAELRAEAAAKMDKTMTEAADQIQLALREGMAELIRHATERLTAEDGKKKIFKDSLIGNIQEFIDCFSAKNIMSDDALAALVAKAQTVLTGIQGKPGQKVADTLRTNEDMRKQTREQFQAISAELEKMIETQQSRDFVFEE